MIFSIVGNDMLEGNCQISELETLHHESELQVPSDLGCASESKREPCSGGTARLRALREVTTWRGVLQMRPNLRLFSRARCAPTPWFTPLHSQ